MVTRMENLMFAVRLEAAYRVWKCPNRTDTPALRRNWLAGLKVEVLRLLIDRMN